MNAPVAIAAGDLTARIDPLGAELVSLSDAPGREYLTDGDPAYWGGHAPLLFPIVGRLAGNRYRLGSAEYELPQHGFARRSMFQVVSQREDAATFRLSDTEETQAAYPFAFVLEMEFALSGTTLAMEARISNPGEAALPFSFGFHPAFAWPLPGSADKHAHRIVFDRAEPAPIRRLNRENALMQPDGLPTPVEGDTLSPHEDMFVADAIIWDRLASRSLSYGAPGGAWLDITFPDCPQLGIWQKPGAAFLAIEPWHGHADPEGFAGDFRDKPGVILLEPGQDRRFRMDVTVRHG